MKKTMLIIIITAIMATTLMLSSCALTESNNNILGNSVINDQGDCGEFEQEISNDDGSLNLGSDSNYVDNVEEKENCGEQESEKSSNEENTEECETTFARVDILLRSTVSGLNVRSAPSAAAKSLGCLDKGDYIAFQDENNGWYTTFYKEKRAYVSARYCEVIEVPLANEKTENIILEGKKLLGYPYVWGSQRYHWGNGTLNTAFVPGKYDCSALMQYIFFKGGNDLLGLTTREQVVQGQKIAKNNIKRGDLLFFTNSSRRNLSGIERVGHVALYLGDNLILHTASDYACIEQISNARWNYYISASRL